MSTNWIGKAIIMAVHGQTPGPAIGITYDVEVYNVGGPGTPPLPIAGVKPQNDRRIPDAADPDNDAVWVRAAKVYSVVDVCRIGGDYLFTVPELDKLTRCSGAGGGGEGLGPFRRGPNGELLPPLPPAGPGSGSGAAGGGQTGDAGGGGGI